MKVIVVEQNSNSSIMEASPISEAKYQKLASEYSKLRAQASVLKKAVLDEQAKSGGLRDQLRQRETALRRAEQENDSLSFRNHQLEQRVGALQQDIADQERRKREKDTKKGGKGDAPAPHFGILGAAGSELAQDAIIFEELQKKIMENAQLTSQVDDKERELDLCQDRITNLEQSLEKRTTELNELERRLRREVEALQHKNTELETKLVEAASMLGSEDAMSASGSDNASSQNIQQTQTHQTQTIPADERIADLEKEVAHWRTQFEIAKMQDCFINNHKDSKVSKQYPTPQGDSACNCSSAAAGLSVKPTLSETPGARDSLKEATSPPTNEQLIYNNFCKKYEDLLKTKCIAESRAQSYETETEHLQSCLESATEELKTKDEQIQNINRALQLLEDDLTTTRKNYEQQISVLTEQVISLSDQLAACK